MRWAPTRPATVDDPANTGRVRETDAKAGGGSDSGFLGNLVRKALE
jgi:hypothetical protein